LVLFIFGFHHRLSGTATLGSWSFSLHSETSLAGAVTTNHINKPDSSENKKPNGGENMSNEHNKGNDSKKVNSIAKALALTVLMVTLVRSAEGSNYILRRCAC
jgi:hypothetical protein